MDVLNLNSTLNTKNGSERSQSCQPRVFYKTIISPHNNDYIYILLLLLLTNYKQLKIRLICKFDEFCQNFNCKPL